jgi:hypothetical protein
LEGYGNYAYGVCVDDLMLTALEYDLSNSQNTNRPIFDAYEMINGTNIVLRWSSFSNQIYALYLSTNLMAGFTIISSNIPAIPPMNTFTDQVDATPQKFWKIGTLP